MNASTDDIFHEYTCTLGTVIRHDGSTYVIRTLDGRTIGIPANGEPSPERVENDIAKPPQPSLADTKARLRGLTKARRAALLASGFSYGSKTIQTRDLADISNIDGAAICAGEDSAFITNWITADNTLLALDADGVIAMQAAMIATGNAIYTAYAILAAQIEAAADLDALAILEPAASTFTP